MTVTAPADPAVDAGRPPLRVLLLAEACNPVWPRGPLVGYEFARALARHPRLDVTVVTHARNAGDLAGDVLTAFARVEYVDTKRIARATDRLAACSRGVAGRTVERALLSSSARSFERAVLRRFGNELTGPGGFDLVHGISPLSSVTPSPLVSHIERPVVLGPINGDLPVPVEFSELPRSEHERRAPRQPRRRILPGARRTYRGLAGLIVGSTRVASDVPRSFRGGCLLLSEIGIEPDIFPVADGWTPPPDRFEFVSVGRLTPLKGVEMVVEAMAGSARLRQARLTIVGDGPEREAIERAVRDYGLAGNVSMPGWLPQRDVAAALARSHAFVRASVSDLRGGAVIEAMSAGLPSIVVDYGGPSDIVDESCGVRVPIAARAVLVAGLRSAMEQLLDDEEMCRRLGRSAAETVRARHTWDARAERIVAFYDEVREESAAPSMRRVKARAASPV